MRRLSALLLAALLPASGWGAALSAPRAVPIKVGTPAVSLSGAVLSAPALSAPALARPTLSAPALSPLAVPALAVPALAPSAIAVAPRVQAAPEARAAEALPAALPSLQATASQVAEPGASAAASLSARFDGTALKPEAADPVSGEPSTLGLRPLSSIQELRMGTYNVLNLFQMVGKWVPDPHRHGKRNKVAEAKNKHDHQLREEAKVILEADLDVVVLQEVENVAALKEFNDRYLEGKYRAILIEGNDERGIDIGFLVKKDLPFDIEQRTHKDETWVDPLGDGSPSKLFSRDLPALIVRAPGRSKPLFALLGTHYKSKRPRGPKDPESEVMRRAQVERTAEIVGRLRAEFGQDLPLMLAGDFNGAVNEESTYDSLKDGGAGLTDALDLAQPALSKLQRVTHTYHPKGGAAHKAQMDGFFVSRSVRGLVTEAKVYRYRDESGREKPLPETYAQRERNPSDHFPLLVTLRFPPLVRP